MFTRGKKQSPFDTLLDKALTKLDELDPGSEEYAKILAVASQLQKLKDDSTPEGVSPDTAALIAANLLGIIMIIRHEHVNVITSRAMNTLIRPR